MQKDFINKGLTITKLSVDVNGNQQMRTETQAYKINTGEANKGTNE